MLHFPLANLTKSSRLHHLPLPSLLYPCLMFSSSGIICIKRRTLSSVSNVPLPINPEDHSDLKTHYKWDRTSQCLTMALTAYTTYFFYINSIPFYFLDCLFRRIYPLHELSEITLVIPDLLNAGLINFFEPFKNSKYFIILSSIRHKLLAYLDRFYPRFIKFPILMSYSSRKPENH